MINFIFAVPTVCGGVVTLNRTWFVNKDFPDYTRDPVDCRLTINRIHPKVRTKQKIYFVTPIKQTLQLSQIFRNVS